MLAKETAISYAAALAANLRREYPNAPQHVLAAPSSIAPSDLHPSFHGCLDWHSAVHSHWALARLSRLFSLGYELDLLSPANLAVEAAYCADRPGFERPYGWAWALYLEKEVGALHPLADVLRGHVLRWLPQERYPIRHGTHGNTAFALALLRSDPVLVGAVDEAALRWYGSDRAYDPRWEPSAHDFLSPGLCEAVLMSAVLGDDFRPWFEAFLPSPGPLLRPVEVGDRSDGQAVHRDGLNLSRAWCLRLLAPYLPGASSAAEECLAASLPYVLSGEYAGEHWLPTFAVLALT